MRTLTVLGVLLASIVLGGCTVQGRLDQTDIVRANQVTIDLTRKPTREDVGLRPGHNDTAYQRGFNGIGNDMIITTVVLPTGTLRLPAFVIAIRGDDLLSAAVLQPKEILVQRVFDTPLEASQSLLADGPTLGFPRPAIDQLLARVSATAGSQIPQQGVIDGLVHDWLAAYVEVIGYEEGEVGVNYHFTIDQFHNPAVDKIVHDGVYGLDLTHRPSRAELGFTEDYDRFADVQPAWSETLAIRLTLPSGVITRRIGSVNSSDGFINIRFGSGSVADIRRILKEDAPLLGFDLSAVEAAFAGPTDRVQLTLPGRPTPVYDVQVKVDASVHEPGNFAAGTNYVFTYH